ncbi:MAG: amidophosphoribosyltransferase [archaeon]
MPAKVGEECGIAAVYLKKPLRKEIVPALLYEMLSKLQHRGQLSAGISVYNPFNEDYEKRLKLLRNLGTVTSVFKANIKKEFEENLEYFKGTAGIGHVRYATAGSAIHHLDLIEEAQPFFRNHPRLWKRFSIAFNGNLVNYDELKKEMAEDYLLDTKVDTEVMMHLISKTLNQLSLERGGGKPDFFEASRRVMEKMDGAYNVVFMFANGELVVWRDPFGFKPLVYGENEDYFAVASESVALERIGIKNFKSPEPGTCMIFNGKELKMRNLFPGHRKAHCHFERVYFARANSVVDGISVNETREKLGINLAINEPLKEDILRNKGNYVVVPVPNTAIPAAEAYAKYFGLNLTQAITRDGTDRGFINKEGERARIMNSKYGVISGRIKGKKIILIEDSIVRGETSKIVIAMIRSAGALEVHFRATEPPIICPCFYGIDFPTKGELIGARFKEDLEKGVAHEIGADSMVYQTVQGLVSACGLSYNELCLACLNGNYPTEAGRLIQQKLKL